MIRPSISVCMATYNGEKFIDAQIESILPQLTDGDELIIIDDRSADRTVELIKRHTSKAIKLHLSERNLGHVKAFERAIQLATNEIIFLADQDDVWADDRIQIMLRFFESPKVSILCTEFTEFGETTTHKKKYVRLTPELDSQPFINILKMFTGEMPYFGCAMCFRGSIKQSLLPFPKFIEAHDLWIASIGNVNGSIAHCGHVSLLRRIHARNLTSKSKRGILEILRSRIILTKMLFTAYRLGTTHVE